MNRLDIEDAIKPYGFVIEQPTNGATNGHFFIMYGKIAVGMLSYGLRDYETFRASCANGFAPPVLLTPENLIPTIEIGAAYQRQQASERYFECLDMMKRLERKSDPEIIESKPDPEIANKPKRPGYAYQTWKQFCDAGMLWWVNRGLHLLGWVLVAMVEEDGTISGVYPARTRYRGFSEKDESEGFRKVTADIQAHMTELVEDCADET